MHVLRWFIYILAAVGLVAPRPLVFAQTVSAEPAHAASIDVLQWSELAPLPDSHGFAGMFAGRLGNIVVAAGGANFPEAPPWEGGAKKWHDTIWVLDLARNEWRRSQVVLPRPLAYGVSVTCELDGKPAVVCVGGDDGQAVSADVFALRYDGREVVLETLPRLLAPRTNACGALVGHRLVVACGQATVDATRGASEVFCLDLSAAPGSRSWQSMAALPGPGRIQAVAGSQGNRFFVFGGIELIAGDDGVAQRSVPYLRSGYRYQGYPWEDELGEDWPENGDWDAVERLPYPVAASPGPAVNAGPYQLLILGGPDGSRLHLPPSAHPGFTRRVQAYDTLLDRWIVHADLPTEYSRVTCPLVPLGNGQIGVISGEIRPGVRSPKVLTVQTTVARSPLTRIDWIVLGIYLVSLVAMGIYASRRGNSTDDFFLGGRRIPWWAAALSVFGTQLSAITFLAIPARTYATNWTFYLLNCGILAVAPLVVHYYLPRFRERSITSAYEYLEQRFSPGIRTLGSLSFILMQLMRMGIVVLLPALALAAVTGLSLWLCILVIGVLSTLYTVVGGIEAVIWTDVIQVVVLLGGAIAALVIVVMRVDGGLWGILTVGAELNKFQMVNPEFYWGADELPVIVLAMVFTNLVSYTTDQAVIQRYLTTPTEAAAARAIWGNGWMSVIASALFFLLGTSLFVYYRQYPNHMIPLSQADQVFPWFIAREMPAGLSGLVIAAVFAAAMSSLDSSMHSIATAISTDFVKRRRPHISDADLLRFARWATFGLGVAGTLTAAYLATLKTRFLWEFFLEMVGLFGGTLCGIFMLGVFSPRVRAGHVWWGALASLLVLLTVRFGTDVSGLAYATIGAVVCYVMARLAALVA